MKLLLIEDDSETLTYIAGGLRSNQHTIDEARTGVEGLALAMTGAHDVIIVDRMMPGIDGLALVKMLRAGGSKTPILFLTTMSGIDDRVEGLDAGGDDYLVKPFAFAELLARVHALGRRSAPIGGEVVTRLSAQDLEIDLLKRTASRRGVAIDLQPQEYRLLEYLTRNAGRVVTRKMLLEQVWDLHFDPGTNIVESHMSRLRAKLDPGKQGSAELIQTVRGAGYILRAD
jgi:two-component system OmpR family response regulator